MAPAGKKAPKDAQPPWTSGIGAIKEIVLAAFRATSDFVRVIIGVSGIAAIVVLMVAIGLFANNQPYLAFWLVVACLILFTVALVALVAVMAVQAKASQASAPAGPPTDAPSKRPSAVSTPWARAVPSLPIPAGPLADLAKMLEEIRRDAFVWLSERHSEIQMKLSDVRANVFLPHISRASNGDCTLSLILAAG